MHLRPTGNSGAHFVPHHVAANLPPVEFVVNDSMGSGAHQTHGTAQHIEQLRQFVPGRTPQPLANAGDPLVIRARLNHLVAVLADGHRTELVDHKAFAIESVPGLTKQRRTTSF